MSLRGGISERSPRSRLRLEALVVGALTVLTLAAPGHSSAGSVGQDVDACTIASAERRAAIEVRVINSAGFCELLSQALAGAVFRSSLLVTPGRLWHYPDTVPTCRLRYRRTEYRMTIFNAADACRWLVRHATGWNVEAGTAEVGAGVRYVRSTYLPADETVFQLFDPPSAEGLDEAGRLATLESERILECSFTCCPANQRAYRKGANGRVQCHCASD